MTAQHCIPLLATLALACGDDNGAAEPPGDTGGTQMASTSGTDAGLDSSSTTSGDGTTGAGASTTVEATSSESTGSTDSTGSNSAPIAVDDVVYAIQNVPLVVGAAEGLLANDSDPDGDPLVVVAPGLSANDGFSEWADDGSFTYSMDSEPGYWGSMVDNVDYDISDPWGATANANIRIHVAPAHVQVAEPTFNSDTGWSFEGEGSAYQSAVDGAGDVNGDGIDDLIIGNGGSNHCYVVFGGSSVPPSDLGSLGDRGFSITGVAGDAIGRAVSGAGDVNGDGLDDVVVRAAGVSDAYVVFGRAETDPVDLGALGSGGFAITGTTAYSNGPAGAGDVDGDGFSDIVVTTSAGAAVVFGKADGAPVDVTALGSGGFVVNGGGEFVGAASGAGDVNDDGLADVIVGRVLADVGANTDAGQAHVVFGKVDTSPVALYALGAGGFSINGAMPQHHVGLSVNGAGDVNGDGIADVIVGATYEAMSHDGPGQAYVVFGKDTDADDVDLGALGAAGFVMNGEYEDDAAGFFVSGAGDVNDDGLADVLVGAKLADGGATNSGRAYVVYGKAGTTPIALGALDGTDGYLVDGTGVSGDEFGRRLGGAGDVNDDGVDDVIIHSNYGFAPGFLGLGRSFVIFGVPTGTP